MYCSATYANNSDLVHWKVVTSDGSGSISAYTSVLIGWDLHSYPVADYLEFSSQVYSVKGYYEKSGFAPAAGMLSLLVQPRLPLIKNLAISNLIETSLNVRFSIS
jgi:hypothetical protein